MKSKFLFVFVCICSLAYGQVDSVVTKTVDSVTVEVLPYNSKDYLKVDSLIKLKPTTENVVFPKHFPEKFKSKYKGEEFDYTLVKPKESIMERMLRRISKILSSIFGEMDPFKAGDIATTIFRIIAIGVIGFLLYFLIRFLVGKDGNFFFSKKNKKLKIASHDLDENIHEIDFHTSIAQYEAQKDWRYAIRYQFLFVLKKLSDQKIIDWNPEKTNKDYLKEIQNSSDKQAFRKLVYIFDNVWYGEFEVGESEYHVFKTEFQNFRK